MTVSLDDQPKAWLISEYEEALVLAKAIGRIEGYDDGFFDGFEAGQYDN